MPIIDRVMEIVHDVLETWKFQKQFLYKYTAQIPGTPSILVCIWSLLSSKSVLSSADMRALEEQLVIPVWKYFYSLKSDVSIHGKYRITYVLKLYRLDERFSVKRLYGYNALTVSHCPRGYF